MNQVYTFSLRSFDIDADDPRKNYSIVLYSDSAKAYTSFESMKAEALEKCKDLSGDVIENLYNRLLEVNLDITSGMGPWSKEVCATVTKPTGAKVDYVLKLMRLIVE